MREEAPMSLLAEKYNASLAMQKKEKVNARKN